VARHTPHPPASRPTDQHRRRPTPPPARHPYQRPAAARGRRPPQHGRQQHRQAGGAPVQCETALHLLAPHQRAGPAGASRRRSSSQGWKSTSRSPRSLLPPRRQSARDDRWLRPFGGFIRPDTRPISTATRGLVLATRPARTTRATTSQDAMNRTDYRTCRPALHLPVLAQLTMRLLHERIPLTLLLDLSEPGGPNSTALLLAEGGADLTAGSAPTSTGRMTRCWTPPWVCTGPGAPSYEPPPHRGQLRHRLPSHAPYIVARQLPGPAGNVMSSTARPSRSTKMTMLVRSRVLAVRGRHSPGHWSGARRDRVGVGDPQLRFIDHGCQWRHGPARGETRREGTPRGPHTPPGGCWTVSQTLDTP